MENEMDEGLHDHNLDEDMVVENNNAYLMAMGEGSRIEIHAADAAKESWTQLETTANAGENTLTLQEETDWEVGDKIAIAATGTNWEEAEEFTILSVSADGKTVTLDGDLQHTHRGVTENYDNGLEGEDHRDWDIEFRAEVALLSRNVRIEGDADSVEDGYGGHTMVMDGAEQHISGVEYFRMGQEDLLGKYPIHWHMLGDAEGQYVENASIHSTYQKGSTIHGTSNIRYEDNVIYDHVGHGVFFEDGSENNNQIYGNLVFSTQESETGEPIPTDGEHVSSFWIENPNNAFIGNHAAGSESNGFWIFEGQLHGLSAETYVGDSGQLDQLVFIGNTGHTTSGDGGAGGTDKILGIDGRITDNLDFGQSTLSADFGTVEGFTAYSGNVWALTHEMVFSDSAFADVRFFSRHENVIKDSVFDSTTNILYRDGGNQYSDVLFTGGARIIPLLSDHVNTPQIFDNVVDDDTRFGFSGATVNQQSIVDISGTFTGIPGGFITPAGANGTFNAAPGAETFKGAFLSEYTIGATEITALGIDGDVRVVRAADAESIDSLAGSVDRRNRGDDNEDRSNANYEFYTTAGMPQDMAYLIDFEDAPEDLTLNLANVREGESVIYEVQNITAIGEVDGGILVDDLDALVNSNETAYLMEGDSLFIRIVADRTEVQDDRPEEDPLADFRSFGKITITGLVEGTDTNHGARTVDSDLQDAIADMPLREKADAPETAEAAVDTNSSYIGYDLKMTEAQTLHGVTDTSAKASFEVNYDVASRTVSFSGKFSDLSSDITMLHLHAGDIDETGSIISSLSFETTDARNGTFEGTATLTEAEAELLLNDETYLNLHTEGNGRGELRGQIELHKAGDFVLERYESTSDTTVVTDDMARWSDEDTWGENGVPGVNDVVVINAGQTVVLDDSALVQGIIVNGGELIIEDNADLDIHLSTDYLLVIEGGLFQAGTEDDPLDTNFVLTLEGDDPDFDLEVGQHVYGHMSNTVFAAVQDANEVDHDHEGSPDTDEENHTDHETTDNGGDDHETTDGGDTETTDGGHIDHETSDGGDTETETTDGGHTDHETMDDGGDDDDTETAEGESGEQSDPIAQGVAAITLSLVDTSSGEARGDVADESALDNNVIGDDSVVVSVDMDVPVGSFAVRVGDYVKVMNAIDGDDGETFEIGLPEGAVFEPGETVNIAVAAYAGPDATGDVLGDVSYSVDVPEEEDDEDDDFFVVEVLEAVFDFITGIFGGGNDDGDNDAAAEFEQTDTLLSDLIPTIEFDENEAYLEEDTPDLVAV